ncbi:uncharacterized protein MYCFIDRAFT_126812, partial [Pseudocercospora fijiensis CIRAD86]
ITRNRESLTCVECRTRKLKCDRQLPCSSCTKRGDPSSCSYNRTPGRKETAESSRASRAESRLQHLEQALQDLVNTSSRGPETNSSDASARLERSNVDDGTSIYTGPTHHAAMLEDIAELRNVIGEQDVDFHSYGYYDSDVLFGGVQALPLPVILSRYLPSRTESDRRLAIYFRAEGIASPFVHVGQFHKQYEAFWQVQYAISPLWISLLFSIFHLSVRSGPFVPSEEDKPLEFGLAAAHCLAIGRYNRPRRFAVEALTTYNQVKLVEGLYLCWSLGMLMGTLAQVAFCMGYHRDPDHFPNITPFEGEMRRRAWSALMQIDLLNSFQLGLPNCVHRRTSWDTRIPGNYHDFDLDPEMKSLPQPKPGSEVTKIMFYNSKHKLMGDFEKILQHATRTNEMVQQPELVTLDEQLRATYESLLEVLRWKNVSRSIAGPIMLIVTRRCIELMYEKCRCVLHRKHITSGRESSIRIAFDAARAIVTSFLDMYPEWKPGGQFYNDRWLLSSVTWHDFLMGVTTLCLILCQDRKTPALSISSEDKRSMIDLLTQAEKVCHEKREESSTGVRAGKLLKAVFSQTDAQEIDPRSSTTDSQIPYAMQSFEQEQQQQQQPELDIFADPTTWQNVFDNQEWAFMEDFLNTNFDSI